MPSTYLNNFSFLKNDHTASAAVTPNKLSPTVSAYFDRLSQLKLCIDKLLPLLSKENRLLSNLANAGEISDCYEQELVAIFKTHSKTDYFEFYKEEYKDYLSLEKPLRQNKAVQFEIFNKKAACLQHLEKLEEKGYGLFTSYHDYLSTLADEYRGNPMVLKELTDRQIALDAIRDELPANLPELSGPKL